MKTAQEQKGFVEVADDIFDQIQAKFKDGTLSVEDRQYYINLAQKIKWVKMLRGLWR